jgi:hypothetical protein
MNDELEGNVEGSGHSLVQGIIPAFTWKDSVKLVTVLSEIWNRHLPNAGFKH